MWNTSISLPVSDDISQDTSGFVTHNKQCIKGIPATKKDTTRADEVTAHQMGYVVSQVFVVDKACYNGAGYLIDDADSVTYDIKRTHKTDKGNLIELTCEVREHGKI